ncbi:hypothetical protein, partial [uncultured Cardiobacterium sp.]|uniref:hypothetical protein n=1 Tax=uncultured Cardiobacterium sp. TaxID=417619 RepID=UPI0026151E35
PAAGFALQGRGIFQIVNSPGANGIMSNEAHFSRSRQKPAPCLASRPPPPARPAFLLQSRRFLIHWNHHVPLYFCSELRLFQPEILCH